MNSPMRARARDGAVEWAFVAFLALTALVSGAMVVETPSLIKLALPGMATLALLLVYPRVFVYASIVLTYMTFPKSFHLGKNFDLVTVYAHEVALVIGCLVLIRLNGRPPAKAITPAIVFAFAIGYATALGVVNGNNPVRIEHETQFLLDMMVAYIFAVLVVRAGLVGQVTKVIAIVLWASAGLIVFSSVTGFALAGRAEELGIEEPIEGTTRFITSTDMLATVVLCAVTALYLLGKGRRAHAIWLVPPAMVITLLAFSRNTLIALAVTAVVCILLSRSLTSLFRLTILAAGSASVALLVVPLAVAASRGTPFGAWLGNQISGFELRVVSGVSSQSLASDSSLAARLQENDRLFIAISKSPWLGHGAGYTYLFPFGNPDGYTPELSWSYAHNFYLWWIVKAGIVGIALFVLFAGPPLARGVLSRSTNGYAAVSVSLALLAISTVAPLPENPETAVILGMTLGATMAFSLPRADPLCGSASRSAPVGAATS